MEQPPQSTLAQPQRRARRERDLLLLALLVVGALLVFSRIEGRSEVLTQERSRLEGQVRAIEQNLAHQLADVHAALLGVRDDLPSWPAAERGDRAHQRMEALREANSGVRAMHWLDAAGRVQASGQADAPGRDDGQAAYFQVIQRRPDAHALYVSRPFLNDGDVYLLNLSIAITTSQGELAGVITATLDPSYFEVLLGSVLYAPDMRATVVHASGVVLVAVPHNPALPGLDVSAPETLYSRHLSSGERVSVLSGPSATGEPRLVAQHTLRPAGLPMDQPLVLAVSRSLDAVVAPWLRQTEVMAALYAALALASWLALLTHQRRRREIERMAAVQQSRLAAEAERLSLALRGGDLALWDAHLPSGQGTVNERWYAMLGYQPGEIDTDEAGWRALLHPEDAERVLAAQAAHVEGRSPTYEEAYRLRHHDGPWVWVLDRGRVVERDADGVALRMVGTHMDITERMQAEDKLRRSEHQLRSLLDALRSGVVVHGPDTQVLDANPAACQMLGLSLDQMRGKVAIDPAWQFIEGDHTPMPLARYPVNQVQANGQPLAHFLGGVLRPDLAHPLWVLCDAFPVRDGEGAVQQIVVTFADITARKLAEEELQRTEARLRMASRLARLGGWHLNLDTQQLTISTELAKILEVDASQPLPAEHGFDFVVPADRERWRALQARCLEDGLPLDDELNAQSVSGPVKRLRVLGEAVRDSAGRIVALQGAAQDLTETRQAQEQLRLLESQLREAQKMESIGTLAGGIAHDFNNILAAILGNVVLARGDLDATHAAQLSLDQIQKAGLRARSLVQQILTFSRRQLNPLVLQPLRPVVEETLALLRATLPPSVQLSTALADAPLTVEADATQLHQVLMNLCTNAAHALPEAGGRIEVGCAALDAAAVAALRLAELAPGPCAHLWVRDSGAGMDAALRERIFDPFFTTKPVGQGTGLGLSVVHGIVRSHHGAIAVESEPGVGSCFHLYVPLLEQPAALAPAPEGARGVAPAGSGQQVLYVDDDEVMRLMAQRLLERAGYEVTVCSDGAGALALLLGQHFDIVVSDYNMPGMSGLELATRMRALLPELPFVISSGHITDELRTQAAATGVHALLMKENTFEELPGLVQQALAGLGRQ